MNLKMQCNVPYRQIKIFNGGCPGNLQAIAALVEGMPIADVIKRLKGISCGGKPSSCADQLAQALEENK